MPTYDYICDDCGHQLEAFQKISDSPLKTCPKCQKESLRRKPGGGAGLSFKGTGFYITDYGSGKENKEKDKPKEDKKDPPASSCGGGKCGCH